MRGMGKNVPRAFCGFLKFFKVLILKLDERSNKIF